MWEVHQSAVRIEKETEGGRRKKKKKKNVWPTSSGGVVTGSRNKNTGTWTHIFPTVRAWLKRPLFFYSPPPLSLQFLCVCRCVCVCELACLLIPSLSPFSFPLFFIFCFSFGPDAILLAAVGAHDTSHEESAHRERRGIRKKKILKDGVV